MEDLKAPVLLNVVITDPQGNEWGRAQLVSKEFSTGSKGFHGNLKVVNPGNPEAKYQTNLLMTLIGSKPAK